MSTDARDLVVDAAVGEWGRATATFSDDRAYRYELTRVWSAEVGAGSGPRLVNFVMLNPSTADAFVLDPTNRRCVGFARGWGYDGLVTTNVFAYRSTDPAGLRAVDDPIGPANDEAILRVATSAALVVAAWGVHAAFGDRESAVLDLLSGAGVELHAVRITKQGHPGHPLYVPGAAEPRRWL